MLQDVKVYPSVLNGQDENIRSALSCFGKSPLLAKLERNANPLLRGEVPL